MNCFPFRIGEKRISASEEINSQDMSDTSTESMGRGSLLSLSGRPTNLRIFTYSELKTATKNFNRTAKLGEGGFGCVYQGIIKSYEEPEIKLDVAVKKLASRGVQGHKEWVTEVNVLGVVEHPNLVKLVGYCAEDDERGIQRLLVYEYMPNKSVEDHLSFKSETTLPWAMRLKIAQDAARGLSFLHEGMDFQIIFRDFKSSNILLDEQWNAKLSDFGLARLGPTEGLTHVSTAVVGTMGYAAPEYVQTGRLTFKSDVWSYGVFLYELITGRRPLERNRPKNEQKLLEWVKPHLTDWKKFRQILDPRLEWNDSFRSARKLAIVANKCLVRHAKSRPKMSEVVEMLNCIVEAPEEVSGSQAPSRDILPKKPSDETNSKAKRRIAYVKMGESNWLFRKLSAKLARTC
ncbi:Non-specific serine/threonine protein kinase [Bertholletia excelsa]